MKEGMTKKEMRLVVAGLVVVCVVFWVTWGNYEKAVHKAKTQKTIKWEDLEGEGGSDLMRLEVPSGWLVENADGYLMLIPDPEKKWLAEEG